VPYIANYLSNYLSISLYIGDTAIKRKNENYAIDLMRKLGLEDTGDISGDSTDDNSSIYMDSEYGICLIIYLFIYLFICLFMYLFIY
jgi:hypothetical protein